MKKIWLLFLVISLVLPLHGMQLQLQCAEAVVEKAVQDIPTLKNLCLKTVAEKIVTPAFEQKLEETDYDFAASRMFAKAILSSVSNGVNKAHERKIKELFCKKYGDSDVCSAGASDESKRIAGRFDRILLKKALAEAFIVNNVSALNKLFASEHIREFFAEAEIEKLRNHYSPDQFPTLKNLCLKIVAEKTVPLAFEQKLEETDYDFAASRMFAKAILSSVSNGVNKAHERKIKQLFRKKYGEFVLHKVLNHGERVFSIAFSSDGEKIASGSSTGSSDGKVMRRSRIWNAKTGACYKVVLSHSSSVYSGASSPDGKKIASATRDSKVRIWDVATGTCDKVLSHGQRVFSVAFSPDGEKIASGSSDGLVKLWNAKTGACDKVLSRSCSVCWDAITAACDKEYLAKVLSRGDWVYSVAFSPDGEKIASGSLDGKVRIWKKQGFDQILFRKAVVKCAKKNDTEALKWLFYDAEMGTLFEEKALKDFKEKVIEEYSISREKLEVSFYSRMMRRCKKAFSKVA